LSQKEKSGTSGEWGQDSERGIRWLYERDQREARAENKVARHF